MAFHIDGVCQHTYNDMYVGVISVVFTWVYEMYLSVAG